MALTLQEWFCLKQDRFSFVPKLPNDGHLVFCHKEVLEEEILNTVKQRFATNSPVKMLFYGDWGVGKTHLTYHLAWWLGQNHADYPAKPIQIEIGDITKKSKFDEVVRPFLDSMGLDPILRLVHGFLAKGHDVNAKLQERGIAANVASAFAKMLLASPGQPPPPDVYQSFEYLKGRKLGGAAAGAGFGHPLEQSRDLVDVLKAIGLMHIEVHGHRILFIADEAAKLEVVEGDDASMSHWVSANRLIFDDANDVFGFIYTISATDLPEAFAHPQIENRLGRSSIKLPNLQLSDAAKYLERLVSSFVDRQKVTALVSDGKISSADFKWECYPFTEAARDGFLDHFNRNQQDSKPRNISRTLDEIAFLAGKLNKRLIDEECLTKKGM